jgi:hypothetical protein
MRDTMKEEETIVISRERYVKFLQSGSVAYQHAKLDSLLTSRRGCNFSSVKSLPGHQEFNTFRFTVVYN